MILDICEMIESKCRLLNNIVQRRNINTKMKIPNATITTASLSGATFGLIISIGEFLGGTIHVVLGIISIFWFLFSVVMFVLGRKPLEYNNEWLGGKRPYLDAQKEVAPRFLLWFISTALSIAVCGIFLKK